MKSFKFYSIYLLVNLLQRLPKRRAPTIKKIRIIALKKVLIMNIQKSNKLSLKASKDNSGFDESSEESKDKQLVDIFTKALAKENFYFFDICRKMLIPDLPFSADIYAQVAREIFGN